MRHAILICAAVFLVSPALTVVKQVAGLAMTPGYSADWIWMLSAAAFPLTIALCGLGGKNHPDLVRGVLCLIILGALVSIVVPALQPLT